MEEQLTNNKELENAKCSSNPNIDYKPLHERIKNDVQILQNRVEQGYQLMDKIKSDLVNLVKACGSTKPPDKEYHDLLDYIDKI